MPRILFPMFARIALLLAAGAAIGWFYDAPAWGLLIASLVALGWNIYWLINLHAWLHGDRSFLLPDGSGIWSEIFSRINYLRARTKRRGKRFKALVKQMRQATRAFPDGGIILSEGHEIITMNRVAEDLLGLKRKQDRGLRIENLIRDPDFVDFLRDSTYEAAQVIRSPHNLEMWLSCHLVPYGLDQKLLLIRDVTNQRKADEMRRDFVANASHELRTPLTVITGYLDALADDSQMSAELRQPISAMQDQADRMRNLVNELLRLSELEAEGPASSEERIDMAALMAAAGQSARAIEGCPETVVVKADSMAQLLGDPGDIQSVLANLVSNAVRHTPQSGSISLRWWSDAKGGYLSVADTGTGVAREHIARLTERFYRVENGRERVGGEGGTGLGLAIVKHALLRHSATLKIESQLGAGTTFTCVFPSERIIPVA